jgi:non-heme chloroperoxidase
MPLLSRDDGRRIYFEHYAGDRRPVVLIHGWGMSSRVWDTTTAALIDAGHEVLVFDQRGCGKSDKDFTEVSIGAGAQDVVELVREAHLDQPVLNGWSLGGAIAAAAASALGNACAGLVLTGAATPRYVQAADFPHGGPPDSVRETVVALRANRTPFLFQLAQAVCALDPGEGVVSWLWQIFQETSPAADAALAELGSLDQRELLRALAVPALVTVGSADAFVPPEIGRAAAELVPDSRLVTYEGCGHAPFLEVREQYHADLLAFLRELG